MLALREPRAHVDLNIPKRGAFGADRAAARAGIGVDGDHVFTRARGDECDAAQAVAAHLRARAIVIDDPHGGVVSGHAGWSQHQDAVTANARAAVAQGGRAGAKLLKFCLHGLDRRAAAVEQEEVVAEAFDLAELKHVVASAWRA